MANWMNEWLVFSLILFGIWAIIFIFKPRIRKEMFWASLFTMPFGLLEPLFVPEYWNPPSLFDLASKIGFDIESLIFSFAIGGIGSVLYEIFSYFKHRKINYKKVKHFRYNLHLLALSSPVPVFILLSLFSNFNSIYSASFAMLVGGIAAIICRSDLKKKTLFGGVLFLSLYFVFFLSFNLIYPYAVERYWNLSALSGILVFGVPLEELIFAFTFGLMWSSVYEHIRGYRVG